MSLWIASLNSGSNGNCYYVGNGKEAVLIDAGISCRETERRMKRLALPMDSVKAIFISHEHADHIAGLTVLSGKYQLPVYITEETQRAGRLLLDEKLPVRFSSKVPVTLGGLTVQAFGKYHDAVDPHSFIVSGDGVNIGIFTDIGRTCDRVVHHFKQCNAVFLEANFDVEMLATGNYPYHLKKRISGGNGHLSNTDALALFNTHRPSFLSHLILSHLSKNNNSPELVEKAFNQYAGNTRVVVASRYCETAVYEVNGSKSAPVSMSRHVQKPVQLSIF